MTSQFTGGGMTYAHATIMHDRVIRLIRELQMKVEWDQTCIFRKFTCMGVWEVLEWVRMGTKEDTAVVCMRCNDCLNLETVSR